MSFKKNSVVFIFTLLTNYLNKFEQVLFDKLKSCFNINHIKNVLELQ